MALMLRCILDSSDAEAGANILEALTVMASLQDTHPGVLCYHFTHPDPENKPNHFEFTEVYGNEGTFWAHSSDPKFLEAYMKGFGDKTKFSSVTYGHGPGMQGKVKEVCDAVLKMGYPSDKAGFIARPQPLDTKSTYAPEVKDGPILLVGQIQAKDGEKVKEILSSVSKLSDEANDGVVVCYASVPEGEKEPNQIELIYHCTTNSHLDAHLCSDKGKAVLKGILEAADSTKCDCYGTLLPVTNEHLSEIGLKVVARETDCGYVLHPHADPAGN